MKRRSFLATALSSCIGFAYYFLFPKSAFSVMESYKQDFRTKHPLRINLSDSKNYYILPENTIFFPAAVASEEKPLYFTCFVGFSGFKCEEVFVAPDDIKDRSKTPSLTDIPPEEYEAIYNRFPFSKEDFIAAVEANNVSKADLITMYNSVSKVPYHKR